LFNAFSFAASFNAALRLHVVLYGLARRGVTCILPRANGAQRPATTRNDPQRPATTRNDPQRTNNKRRPEGKPRLQFCN
jgi:hypothetical protein